MCFVALDARKATVNSAKEMSLRNSQRTDRKPGMGITLLSTMSNTGEALEVSNWTLKERRNRIRKRKKTKE